MHGNKTGKKRLLAMFLLFVASAVIGLTGAVIIHQLTLENPIKTPTVEGKITEDNQGNTKNAVFVNTGEANVFLRVAYSESWTYQEAGKEPIILPNEALVEETDPTDPTKVKYVLKPIANPDISKADWTDGEDGWWYYNEVLLNEEEAKAIKTSSDTRTKNKTAPFVEEVKFDNVSKAKDERYRKAKYQLHFTMEVVQCSDQPNVSIDAVEKLFKGKTVDLSESWPKPRTFEWQDTTTGTDEAEKVNEQNEQIAQNKSE